MDVSVDLTRADGLQRSSIEVKRQPVHNILLIRIEPIGTGEHRDEEE
jgi:hypothetical protein